MKITFLFLFLLCTNVYNAVAQEYRAKKEMMSATAGIKTLKISNDNKSIASGGTDGRLSVWDADANTPAQTLASTHGKVTDYKFSKDGYVLAVAFEDGNTIIWDWKTNTIRKTFPPDTTLPKEGQKISFIDFGERDNKLIIGRKNNKIDIITRPLTDKPLSESFNVGAGKWKSPLAFTCGKYNDALGSIVAGSGKNVYYINPMDGSIVKSLGPASDTITSLDVNADGSMVATKAKNRYVDIWDPKQSGPIRSLRAYSNSVSNNDSTPVSFSKDGKLLASGSTDDAPSVWNLETYELQYKLFGHKGSVEAIAYTNDGQIVTGGSDSAIRIWKYFVPDTTSQKKVIKKPAGKNDNEANKVSAPANLTYKTDKTPESIEGRKVNITSTTAVYAKKVILYIWDDDIVDGDVVSLNFNGNWILDHYTLTKERRAVTLILKPGEGNYIILYSNSAGTTGPCTAGVAMDDGFSVKEVSLLSNLKTSDAIKLMLK